MISGTNLFISRDCRICFATSISFILDEVKETLIVSPIPSVSKVPIPIDDFTSHVSERPVAVTPI
jgi:hypothetical protein